MISVTEPTLVLDKVKCERNIARMAQRAALYGVRYRPHFKTHQSLTISDWFKTVEVSAVTVSSVKMAMYFSARWNDITIAFPFNILEIGRVNNIPPSCHLNVCVLSAATIQFLEAELHREVGVYIKIDVGYHRTGLQVGDPHIHEIVSALKSSKKMRFMGFLGHAGHSYKATSIKEIRNIDRSSRQIMADLKNRYLADYPKLEISLGDTPTCSLAEDFNGIDEIRPGNLVFYDLQQALIGSCTFSDIAVALACPVVAVHKDKLVLHGGGAHLSKEFLLDTTGNPYYGLICNRIASGWSAPIEGLKLSELSQEHGIVTGPLEELNRFCVGDIVLVLPIHSCMTACQMKRYVTLDGEEITHLEAGASPTL